MFSRTRVATLVGEFLGTGLLTLVFLAVSRTVGYPFFVALAIAVTAAVLVTTFTRSATGAHLNPAITLGLWTVRKVKTIDAILIICLQLIGAYLAYLLFSKVLVDTPIANDTTGFSQGVLVAEAVGTFVLAFAWSAAYNRGYRDAKLGAIVGLAYAAGILAVSAGTLPSLNPAAALGLRQFELGTHVLGPILGAVIGFNLQSLLFADRADKTVKVAAETAVVREAVAEDKPASRTRKVATTAKAPVKAAAKKTTSRTKKSTK